MHDWLALEPFNTTAMQLSVELVVKTCCVLLLGFVLHFLLQKRFAVLCSSMWNAALVVLLLLPLASLIPPLPIPIQARQRTALFVSPRHVVVSNAPIVLSDSKGPVEVAANIQESSDAQSAADVPLKTALNPQVQPASFVMMVLSVAYIAGVFVVGYRLLSSVRAVRLLLSGGQLLSDERWRGRLAVCQARTCCAGNRTKNVRLLRSGQTQIPFATGCWQPTIVIPEELVSTATFADIDVILMHELTHIVRRDCIWQWLLKCVQAIYWFNPLIWLAGRLIRETRESICDRYCLNVLGNRQQYSDGLLHVASALLRPVSIPLCVPMVRTPRIAHRLQTISRIEGLRHCVASRSMRCAVLLFALTIAGVVGAGIVTVAAKDHAKASSTDREGNELPAGATARLGTLHWRHGAQVGLLQFSADGERVVSWDGSALRIWETKTGKLISRSDLAGAEPAFVSFFKDQPAVAILTTFDGQKYIWRFETDTPPQLPRQPTGILERAQGDYESITNFAISPDGQILATGTSGYDDRPRTIQLWRFAADKPIHEQEKLGVSCEVPGTIEWLAFSPDNNRLIAVSRAGGMGETVQEFQNPEGTRTITVLDLNLGAITSQFSVPKQTRNGNNSGLAISPNGKHLAVCTAKGPVRLFDLDSSQEVTRFDVAQTACVAFSPTGDRLAVGGRDQMIHVWNLEDKTELFSVKGHASWIEAIAFSPNGKVLATGGQDHLAKLWDLTTRAELPFGDGHQSWVNDVSLTKDGRTAVTGASDGTIRVWDTETGAQRKLMKFSGLGWVTSVAISPDDKEIIAGQVGGVGAYEISSGKKTWEFKATDFCSYFTDVHFDQKNHLACLGADGAVYIWNYAQRDRQPQRIISERKDARTTACALSPDGDLLALSTSTQMAASSEIEIWSVRGGRLLQKMNPRLGGVDYLEFSPDGGHLLSTGHSTTNGFIGNRSIASPNLEDSVLLWDLGTGEIIRKYGLDPNHLPSVRIPQAATFSRDGQLLITAERDGSILIYRVDSGERLAELHGHSGEVQSVCITADGQRLVSVSTDLTGLVWDMNSILK